jgi:hypothetical protein
VEIIHQIYNNMKASDLHRRQPRSRKKKVWDTDEHVGRHKKSWYTGAVQAKPYGWSKTGTFNGQSEGYADHII